LGTYDLDSLLVCVAALTVTCTCTLRVLLLILLNNLLLQMLLLLALLLLPRLSGHAMLRDGAGGDDGRSARGTGSGGVEAGGVWFADARWEKKSG